MWDFINANANLLVTLATLAGGYLWHRFVVGRTVDNEIAKGVLAAIGSIFDGYVASASTDKTLETIRIELRGLAAVQLGRAGIYEGTALRGIADAAVNALIERAIATFVQQHPTPSSLHAEVKVSAIAPAVA